MESPGLFTLAPPVQAFPLVALGAGTRTVFTGRGRLFGWSMNGAATATIDIFDGPAATGQLLGSGIGSADTTPPVWFGPQGIDVESALTIVTAVAVFNGAIYYQTETALNNWLAEIQTRAGVRYSTGNNWQGVPVGFTE